MAQNQNHYGTSRYSTHWFSYYYQWSCGGRFEILNTYFLFQRQNIEQYWTFCKFQICILCHTWGTYINLIWTADMPCGNADWNLDIFFRFWQWLTSADMPCVKFRHLEIEQTVKWVRVNGVCAFSGTASYSLAKPQSYDVQIKNHSIILPSLSVNL